MKPCLSCTVSFFTMIAKWGLILWVILGLGRSPWWLLAGFIVPSWICDEHPRKKESLGDGGKGE